ncbi:MAG: helix-turn-helix transcriptional regulator [Oscillospiraceae bacterium]|nr:helix-turn-helix transcriptional regulator [Oscillospiraceae bacterium]
MLIFDSRAVGNKLLAIRKRMGLTQMQVAEAAELSDRAYADIERGTVNMRMDTILRICRALHVTPDEIFTEADEPADVRQEELLARLEACSPRDRETALELLSVFLRSLDR